MMKEQLMTAQEVAAYLRCSVSTVRRLVARAAIPHYRLGKMVRFRRREIDNWLTLYRVRDGAGEGTTTLADPKQLTLFDLESDPETEASGTPTTAREESRAGE